MPGMDENQSNRFNTAKYSSIGRYTLEMVSASGGEASTIATNTT